MLALLLCGLPGRGECRRNPAATIRPPPSHARTDPPAPHYRSVRIFGEEDPRGGREWQVNALGAYPDGSILMLEVQLRSPRLVTRIRRLGPDARPLFEVAVEQEPQLRWVEQVAPLSDGG